MGLEIDRSACVGSGGFIPIDFAADPVTLKADGVEGVRGTGGGEVHGPDEFSGDLLACPEGGFGGHFERFGRVDEVEDSVGSVVGAGPGVFAFHGDGVVGNGDFGIVADAGPFAGKFRAGGGRWGHERRDGRRGRRGLGVEGKEREREQHEEHEQGECGELADAHGFSFGLGNVVIVGAWDGAGLDEEFLFEVEFRVIAGEFVELVERFVDGEGDLFSGGVVGGFLIGEGGFIVCEGFFDVTAVDGALFFGGGLHVRVNGPALLGGVDDEDIFSGEFLKLSGDEELKDGEPFVVFGFLGAAGAGAGFIRILDGEGEGIEDGDEAVATDVDGFSIGVGGGVSFLIFTIGEGAGLGFEGDGFEVGVGLRFGGGSGGRGLFRWEDGEGDSIIGADE